MPTGRQIITILLVAAAATTLAFATGATVVDDPADTFAEDQLVVQPADSPNGDYAYLNDDNEIVIDISVSNPNLPNDFEGINPNALAAADGVFTVTYTADEYVRVWIDHPEENVTFVIDGNSIEGKSNNVMLGPNETVPVGLQVDARGAAADTTLGGDDFDIRAEIAEPENIQVTATDDDGDDSATTTVQSPRPARREFEGSDLPADEKTTFDADGMRLSEFVMLDRVRVTSVTGDVAFETTGSAEPFENVGPLNDSRRPRPEAYFELNHSFTAEEVSTLRFGFSVDREYLNKTGADPEDVSLYRRSDAEPDGWEPLETERVDPEVRRLLGLSGDRIHLTATTDDFSVFAVATERPMLRPMSAALDREVVGPGEPVTVGATIKNEGGTDGEETMTLTTDGDPVATDSVAIAPDETTGIAYTVSFNESGAYDLVVDGEHVIEPIIVGTVIVTSDGNGPNSGVDTTEETDTELSDTTANTEESASFELSDIAGLVTLLIIILGTLFLVRRAPW